MCDPVSIAGGVAMVAGTLMAAKASAGRDKAKQKVVTNELARQNVLKDQAGKVFQNTVKDFTPEKQQSKQASIEQERITDFTDAAVGGNTSAPISGSAPQIVSDEGDRQSKAGLARARNTAVLLAKQGGFADLFFDNNLAINRGNQDISVVGSLQRGSAGVIPFELSNANRVGQNLELAGSLLNAGGSAGVMAGTSGIGPSFSSLFGGVPLSGGATGITTNKLLG